MSPASARIMTLESRRLRYQAEYVALNGAVDRLRTKSRRLAKDTQS